MNNGQWALIAEVVRHVEPFLGLSLHEFKALEATQNVSIRQHSVLGRTASVPEPYSNALHKLRDLRIALPSPEPDTHIINMYGLARFYRVLAGESSQRKTTAERLARTDTLLEAIQGDFEINEFPLLDLNVSVPELTRRQAVQVGRTRPVLSTLLKHRLIEASMGVAIDYLKTGSEFVVFMRCINMTLERNVITCPMFSIDRVLFGHAPRGSLGLPIGEKSVRTALKRLQGHKLVTITRPYDTCKAGQLTINAAGHCGRSCQGPPQYPRVRAAPYRLGSPDEAGRQSGATVGWDSRHHDLGHNDRSELYPPGYPSRNPYCARHSPFPGQNQGALE